MIEPIINHKISAFGTIYFILMMHVYVLSFSKLRCPGDGKEKNKRVRMYDGPVS